MTLTRKQAQFGDGIMSAIDFSMDLQREPGSERRSR
jgi:cyanate lyase